MENVELKRQILRAVKVNNVGHIIWAPDLFWENCLKFVKEGLVQAEYFRALYGHYDFSFTPAGLEFIK